jgi:hypothetical protein
VLVVEYLRVRCVAEHCANPAHTSVPVEEVAPGVLALPRLICRSCRCELKVEE